MKPMHLLMSALVAFAPSLAACADGDADEDALVVPGSETGTLLQTWSIEGGQDLARCALHGADRMRVIVVDERGQVDATALAPCASFELRLTLQPQRYTAAATFLGIDGAPVSQTLPLTPFTITGASTATSHVDFPAAAMRP